MDDKTKIKNAVVSLHYLYNLLQYIDESLFETRDETIDKMERDYMRPLRFLYKRELERVIEDLEKE